VVHRNPAAERRHWLFDQLRERYEHPLEVRAYERQVAHGLLSEERAILERTIVGTARILVLGCGAGREAFVLEAMGHQVVGVDISQEMIKTAKRQAARRGSSITWMWMPAPLEIPLPTHSFDGVVAFAQLLSHIPNAEARIALLSEIRRVLRPQGVLVASFTTRRAARELTGESKDAERADGSIRSEGSSTSELIAEEPFDEPDVDVEGDALSGLELAAGWEDGDILVWEPSDAELDEPLFFHLHTDDEIRNEVAAAGLELVDLVDPRKITDRPAWDAHRYPFLVAKAP